VVRARLYRGPFNGKVLDATSHGGVIIITGPKKMTRKEKYEWDYQRIGMFGAIYAQPYPMIEARYTECKNPYAPHMPLWHPDGSVFYEYVEGSKRER
jgi:hypothetical protein